MSDAVPPPFGVADSRNWPGLSLLSLICNPPDGLTPVNRTLAVASRPFPTVTLTGTSPAALTDITEVFAPPAGMLKPAGTLALTVVLPPLTAVHRAVAVWSPALNVSGEPEIVPTLVFELSTTTWAPTAPRSC